MPSPAPTLMPTREPCRAGKYSDDGLAPCTDCNAGSYSSVDRATSCELCPTNTFSPSSGLGICTDCPAGRFSGIGFPACSSCAPGEAEFVVDADIVCVPCGEGTYSPLGIYCLTCLAGSYTADQINCNPCDAGTFSATDGATSCTACPPGWHQPASGQLECERCEPGRVASVSGQASCDRCDAGTYSAAAGASTCVDCAPGRIQSESGRSECEQCAAGRFASSATACSSCLQFGAGRTSPPGAAVCDICEADYYYDGQSCLDCPWSATCARNSTLGSQWIVDEGFYRFSMDTPEIYRCKRNDGCVGGAGSGDDLCANHHHGPLCHLCDRGYYMEPVLRTCQRCDQRPSTFLMVAFFFFVLIVLFVFAVLIWSCVWGSGYTKELLQALKSSHLRRWVQTHFGDFFRSDCARAIWYSWTVLVRFSSVEDVKYPGPFAWVMRIYGLVTLDLVAWLPTPCIRWSYYDTLLAATLLPVAYVLVAWLYNLGRRHLRKGRHAEMQERPGEAPAPAPAVPEASAPPSETPHPEAASEAKDKPVVNDFFRLLDWCFSGHGVVTVLVMVHAPICSVLFEFFHFDGRAHDGFSTSAHETELYLARDYRIRESDAKYQAYRAYAILCCLIYVVVIPLFFLVALLAKKSFDGHFDTPRCISFLLRQVDGLVKRLRRKADASDADCWVRGDSQAGGEHRGGGPAAAEADDAADDAPVCTNTTALSGDDATDEVTSARCPKPLLPLWETLVGDIWELWKTLVGDIWETLVGPYKEVAWFTEPLSMVVRTSLSGFLLICLPQAKRMRIVLSFGIALIYALLVSDFKPFKSAAVNMVASTFWFFVTSTFFYALCVTQGVLKLPQLRAISTVLVIGQLIVFLLAMWRHSDEAPIRVLCRKIKRGNKEDRIDKTEFETLYAAGGKELLEAAVFDAIDGYFKQEFKASDGSDDPWERFRSQFCALETFWNEPVSEPHKRREAEIWLARDHVAQIEAGLKKQAENAKGTDLEKKEQEKLDRFMSKKEQDIEDDWSQPTKTAHQKKIDILQEIATSEGGTKREIRATRWAWLRSQAKAEADKLEKTIRETPTVKEIDQKIKDIGYPNDLVLDEGARVSVKASDKRKAGEGTIVSVNADGTFDVKPAVGDVWRDVSKEELDGQQPSQKLLFRSNPREVTDATLGAGGDNQLVVKREDDKITEAALRGEGGQITEAALLVVKRALTEDGEIPEADGKNEELHKLVARGKLMMDKEVLPPMLRVFAYMCLPALKKALDAVAEEVGDVKVVCDEGKSVKKSKRMVEKMVNEIAADEEAEGEGANDDVRRWQPISASVREALRATLVCPDQDAMYMVYEELKNPNGKFTLRKVKNKLEKGKVPFNLHAVYEFQPSPASVSILVEVQIKIKEIEDKCGAQHKFYEISRVTGSVELFKPEVDTHDEQTPEELTKRLGAHDKGRFMLQRSNVVTSRHLVERESKARKSGGWRLMRFISKRRGRRETVHPDQPPKAPPVRRAVQDEEEDDSDSYPISYP